MLRQSLRSKENTLKSLEDEHIKHNIEKIYAIIELKYKGSQVPVDCFINDVEKTVEYIKDKDLEEMGYYISHVNVQYIVSDSTYEATFTYLSRQDGNISISHEHIKLKRDVKN